MAGWPGEWYAERSRATIIRATLATLWCGPGVSPTSYALVSSRQHSKTVEREQATPAIQPHSPKGGKDTLMPRFALDVWVTRDFPRTWTHVIDGPFADPQFDTKHATDLLCYDGNSGIGAFFATVKAGRLDDGTAVQDGPHRVGANLTFSRRWTHIVNAPFAPPYPGGVQLLFYDAASGVGEFYATDGSGNLILTRTHYGWRTSWTHILGGRFGNANLLFYDAANGTGEFYSVDGSGYIHLIRTIEGWRSSWHSIITGNFSRSQYDDLLFYDKGAGVGEFYRTDGQGGMTLFSEHDNWRTSWRQVLSGQFLQNSTYDGLLFYEESSGYTELYSTDGHGSISQIDVNLGNQWALPWQVIRAGVFTPYLGIPGTSSLCNYDPTDGVIASFYLSPIPSR
jgi:hypothetical protein